MATLLPFVPAGYLEFLLPFFFVLAVVYGSLEYAGTFKGNRVKGLISLVIAFFAISSQTFIDFIFVILPYAAIFFVGIFFIGIVLSFFKDDQNRRKKDFTLMIVIIGLILIFLTSQNNSRIFNLSDPNLLYALGLLLVIILFYAGYKKTQEGHN